jgi:transcriptional regulator with PAS, ATPase and Fis domain
MTELERTRLPSELVSVLDALPGPRILLDLEYRILAANQAYREEYGDPEGLIGRTCYEVSHRFPKPCDQCGESCPRASALQTGRASRVLHLHYVPQGREYVDVELIPIRGADKHIRYFIEAMTPLRERSGERPFSGMAGQSAPFKRMLEMIHRVANRNTSVLLLGESGTGKELAAQALHDLSQRAGHPFVPVDCSGMTESLFESELFGHEKGAFTGASQRKAGLVEAAAGGTLFLDELGDIPLSLQVKLLRLLEAGSFRRVGGTETLRADFRLIAATHRDLLAMVEAGTFRRDLYYRIAAFPIELPALRERKEDLALLAEDILGRISPDKAVKLAPAAMAALMAYDFPGNVRELRNILERAIILTDGESIDAAYLPAARSESAHAGISEIREESIVPLEVAEKHYLQSTLDKLGGDKGKLAKRLGISRRTIDRKLSSG